MDWLFQAVHLPRWLLFVVLGLWGWEWFRAWRLRRELTGLKRQRERFAASPTAR